jgi:hypothetical protein
MKIPTGNDKKIYVFTRMKEKNQVLVILNLSPGLEAVRLEGHSFIGTYRNVFSGEIRRFEDISEFTMKPWEYLVFVKQ